MRLELPHLDANDPLRELASITIARPSLPLPRATALPPIPARLWEPAPFGIENARMVHDATDEDRRAIVGLVAREVIEQTIAAAGASQAVAAKLIGLAHSAEERWLFSRRAADQARLEAALLRFLPGPLIEDPHLEPLSSLFDRADREGMIAIEQLLSAWRSGRHIELARGCRSEGLRQTLQHAAEEEALYQQLLVVLLARAPRSRAAPAVLPEILRRLELRVIDRIADVLGDLAPRARIDLISELRLDSRTVPP